MLIAGLEKEDDPDANRQKNYTYCDGSAVQNTKAYVLTNP